MTAYTRSFEPARTCIPPVLGIFRDNGVSQGWQLLVAKVDILGSKQHFCLIESQNEPQQF